MLLHGVCTYHLRQCYIVIEMMVTLIGLTIYNQQILVDDLHMVTIYQSTHGYAQTIITHGEQSHTKGWSKWYIIIFWYLLLMINLIFIEFKSCKVLVIVISKVDQSVMIDWDMRWLLSMSRVLIVILISLHDLMLRDCMPVMLAKIFVHNTGTQLVLHNEICFITLHNTSTTHSDQKLFSNIDL